nr:hypothetical protein [uncultured Leptotrichia sp.]
MDLENVRKEILGVKLDISEYFRVAFSVFKILLKENKLLMFFSFLITLTGVVSGVIVIGEQIIGEAEMYEYYDIVTKLILALMSIVYLIFNIGSPFFKGYFFRKVAFKLENNTNNLNLGKLSIKVLKLLGVVLILSVISIFAEKISSFIGSIVTIWALLYFFEAYYIRNLGLKDSANYSLELSKGNRYRVIVPNLIVGIPSLIGIVSAVFILSNQRNGFIILGFFFLFTIIAAIVLLYMEIFNIVVFLNVEYNYLKNQGENDRFNFKNIKTSDDESDNNDEKDLNILN